MLEFESQALLSLHDKAALYRVGMDLKDRLKRARKAADLTQAAVASMLAVTPQAVSGWERGESEPDADKFLPLAKLFGVKVAWLHGEPDSEGDSPALQTQAPVIIPKENLQQQGRPDFKIFASVEGGPGQLILSTEPVDFQPRPAILQNVQNAYGLIVSGDSMSPEYRNGDTALINPHLATIGDEVYVFYTERHGEARATIKHLRRATSDKWHVTQHNPPADMEKDFTLSRKEWRVAHRVLGKYARR